MAAQIIIVNTALVRLGARPVSSMTSDNSIEARIAASQYDIARRALLTEHSWNFALSDALLVNKVDLISAEVGALSSAPGYRKPAYRYSFQLPAQLLRLWKVYESKDFRIQGQRILSNDLYCRIKFTRDVEDTSLFTPDFDDLLAQRLAADMAYPITKSSGLAGALWDVYNQKLRLAKAKDTAADPLDDFGAQYNEFLDVRL